MSILKKVFFITILVLLVSYNSCFAIDENQFASNPEVATDANNQVVSQSNVVNSNSVDSNSTELPTDNTDTPAIYDDVSSDVETTETQSTTVSNVSNLKQSNSTVSNILNISLIVVGVLLIFLAIAILLRLH